MFKLTDALHRVAVSDDLFINRLVLVEEFPALEFAVVSVNGHGFTLDGQGAGRRRVVFRTPVLSPDGKRVACVGEIEKGRRVFVDGKGGPTGGLISQPTFSKDGRHVAFIVWPSWESQSGRVYMDGRPGPRYDRIPIGRLRFNPDGSTEYLGIREGRLYKVHHKSVSID